MCFTCCWLSTYLSTYLPARTTNTSLLRKSLNKEYVAGLKEILQSAAEDISDHTGKFLHTLREKKPDKDTLQKMISASPSRLDYKDDEAQLPIQSAMCHGDSARYVPLLAKEGVEYNMGGKDGRGSLIVIDPRATIGFNTFHSLANKHCSDNPWRDMYDKACVDVMKELKDANPLTKDDIKNHGLLYLTFHSQGCKQQFEFLCDWCPEGLKGHRYKNRPIIHAIIKDWSIGSFAMCLKAANK